MWSQQTQLQTTWSPEMRPSPQHHNSEKRVLLAWVAFHKTGGWGTQLHTTGTRNPHDLNEETTERKKTPQWECDDMTSGCDSTWHEKDAAPHTFRMWPHVWHERDYNLAQHNNYMTQHVMEAKKVLPHDMKVKKVIPHDAVEKSANPHTREWILHNAQHTLTPQGNVKSNVIWHDTQAKATPHNTYKSWESYFTQGKGTQHERKWLLTLVAHAKEKQAAEHVENVTPHVMKKTRQKATPQGKEHWRL